MKILDLGCGHMKYCGGRNDKVIGLDIDKNSSADVIHNLDDFPYPFKDNEFDMVCSNQVLQFVSDLNKTLKELYRICRNGAAIQIIVPHFSSYWAHARPNTKQVFSCELVRFLEEGGSGCKAPASFRVKDIKLFYGEYKSPLKKAISSILSTLANTRPFACERIWCNWVGGFSELHFELEVVKPKKQS